jgi:RNA polymerase sigma factor (sigma-70 family)
VREQTIASSAREVLAVEPVIRRVVVARAANPADVDDLVQDCLERLLVARERLAPEAILPYAVVTARNLVSSHAKSTMRHAAAAPRILDTSEPDRPEEMVLAGETRRAMTMALSQLSPSERDDILAYHTSGPAAGGAATESPGALRVRMSRTRAKLRLEYLLAFRHLELPTPLCRSVLLAISAGDRRRQREYSSAQHLLDCETCAALSEPLDRRSAALTAITIPVGLVVWTASKVRAHPVHAAVSVTAGSAAAVAAVVFLAPGPVPAVRAQVASPAVRPSPPAVISHLLVDGRPVRDTQVQQSIRSAVGDTADASGVSVVTAVTRNGFWVGSAQARIWVELVGPLRPLRINARDRVRFVGTMVANPPSYPERAGLRNSGDASLLARQGAHITVSTARISVQRAS